MKQIASGMYEPVPPDHTLGVFDNDSRMSSIEIPIFYRRRSFAVRRVLLKLTGSIDRRFEFHSTDQSHVG